MLHERTHLTHCAGVLSQFCQIFIAVSKGKFIFYTELKVINSFLSLKKCVEKLYEPGVFDLVFLFCLLFFDLNFAFFFKRLNAWE